MGNHIRNLELLGLGLSPHSPRYVAAIVLQRRVSSVPRMRWMAILPAPRWRFQTPRHHWVLPRWHHIPNTPVNTSCSRSGGLHKADRGVLKTLMRSSHPMVRQGALGLDAGLGGWGGEGWMGGGPWDERASAAQWRGSASQAQGTEDSTDRD
jgi:hypothetical protein